MPRFTGQNKKRIDPRYFLNEKREVISEDLMSSIFLKARESAELDILSYFSMPSESELERIKIDRNMPESKRPTTQELRDYLIYGAGTQKTSGFNYRPFAKKAVPDDQAQRLASKVGLDMRSIMMAHERGNSKWPLPGIDLTNYMVYWMMDSGTIKMYNDGKIYPTVKGGKRFHQLMGNKRKDLPDTIQGGEDARFSPRDVKKGKPLDLSKFKME